MVAVAVCSRELPSAVVHRCRVHCHRRICHTGIFRHRNTVKQVLSAVHIVLGSELQTVIEHSEVETDVLRYLLLPGDILADEVGDSRTVNYIIAETVAHIVTCHGSHVSILTYILVTELSVAGAQFEHIDDILWHLEERLLIDTPSQRY